jgi:hypothetical protein
MQGHGEEALSWVQEARERMAALPEQGEQPELVEPWNVREIVLRIGGQAAGEVGRWQEALDFEREVVASMQARGATELEEAIVSFNGSLSLLQLGELEWAGRVLLACREVFEHEGALEPLGRTLGALASLEWWRGHDQEAMRLERTALRYAYVARSPEAAANGHHNIASGLRRAGTGTAPVLAHRLAAALIWYQLGDEKASSDTLDGAARDLAGAGDPPPLPGSFADLCDLVGQVQGVQLADLSARLPRHGSGDDTLAEVIRLAAERARAIREATT